MCGATPLQPSSPQRPQLELTRWRILLFKGVEIRQADIGDFLLSVNRDLSGALRRK
jgi:hypothetical protein